jgi:hypothetical protein
LRSDRKARLTASVFILDDRRFVAFAEGSRAVRSPMTTDPADLHPLDEPRKRVGVILAPVASSSSTAVDQVFATDPRASTRSLSDPAAAAHPRLDPAQERLLAALELVFPVRFERGEASDLDRVDGLLVIGPGRVAEIPMAEISTAEIPTGIPRLVLPASAPRRGSRAHGGGADASDADASGMSGEIASVRLSSDSALARPLRGRAIPESAIAGEPTHAPARGTVLAGVESRPVWWQIDAAGAPLSVSAYPLAGLRAGETLRDHLRAGRFMGLLPLVHFLGQVLADRAWRLPPPRAAFIVDDPNLHWPSYGFLKYGELAAHAVRHGYHVGFATVPLDGWLINPRVSTLLAQNTSVLSLLLHGNDHVARELGRLDTDAAALPAIAQALRRIAALERRSGMTVERVMAPPHGACSEAALRAMFRLGIEAACSTQPHPWRYPSPPATPLAGWHPAEMVAGGLPVLPRYPLGAPTEDLVLRALLGQPLIVYGHHDDFAQGLDILAQTASEINALGDVRWGPLGQIARASFATRQTGETLLVRMHARRIAVDVPAGVRALRVLVQEPFGGAAGHSLTHADGCMDVTFAGGLGVSEPLAVAAPARVELTLTADRPLHPAAVPSRGIRLWPWIRRALVEGRDHVQALRQPRWS